MPCHSSVASLLQSSAITSSPHSHLRARFIHYNMFKHVALLLLCSSVLWSRFTSYAAPSKGGFVKQKPTKLEDIIGLFVCGGTDDKYSTHTTTLNEYEIENFSHKVSYQLWVDSGVKCTFKNGPTLGNITWATSTTGENSCSTTVERTALNGGIQRYLRAHPSWKGRQCLIILHGKLAFPLMNHSACRVLIAETILTRNLLTIIQARGKAMSRSVPRLDYIQHSIMTVQAFCRRNVSYPVAMIVKAFSASKWVATLLGQDSSSETVGHTHPLRLVLRVTQHH